MRKQGTEEETKADEPELRGQEFIDKKFGGDLGAYFRATRAGYDQSGWQLLNSECALYLNAIDRRITFINDGNCDNTMYVPGFMMIIGIAYTSIMLSTTRQEPCFLPVQNISTYSKLLPHQHQAPALLHHLAAEVIRHQQ